MKTSSSPSAIVRIALPPLANLALLALAFFAAASLAFKLFGTNTPLWYCNAIALVALLKHPRSTWPVLLLAVWLADALAVHTFGSGGPPLLIGLCDVGEIALAAALIHATGGLKAPIFSGTQAARVMAVCLAVPVLSAAAGAALLAQYEGLSFLANWRIWYSASALGLVTVTPFLLIWADPLVRKDAIQALSPMRVGGLVLGAATASFLLTQNISPTLLFLSFPVMLVMTWGLGVSGVTAGLLVCSVTSMWATVSGDGPLAGVVLPQTDLTLQVEAAQLYVAAVLFSSLPLAILMIQQKLLTADLRRVGDARAEFLAAMSHEIRTPMTAVLGLVDMLRSEPLAPAHKGYVDAMYASGRHLLSVINDILDYSRIESGKLELERVDFSLPDLLEALRVLSHPLAVDRGLHLRMELSPHSPAILHGDPTRIQQVLLNLVGNAIKFTPSGSVTVTVSQCPADCGARFRFEVRDTGVGIDPQRMERLFAPFIQGGGSTARHYGGSGLGLAISKRLVQAMGGQIGVHSSPGLGSVFHFEIPLELGDPLNLVSRTGNSKAPVQPRCILVVEDVEINRVILQSVLGKHGHQLVFAEHGGQAVELVQKQRFDLVLMDVQMPVMDGVEATRRIRKLPGPERQIPIIGLTANVMARERERYLEAGMNDCAMKPIEWEVLEAAIARHAVGVGPVSSTADPVPTAQTSASLLDLQALSGLRSTVGEQEFRRMVAAGMDTYQRYCDAMTTPGAALADVRREAHKLKGSAGTFGLRGISMLATQIESALDDRVAVGALLAQLKDCIGATRRELVAAGTLGESAAPGA